mmetsp:Transcript_33612/g.72877  ORF Transcript_33612/g.72877 Transcript_33612/m.72877 type:complete len:96 (+) Transcript_33612:138-425(+)
MTNTSGRDRERERGATERKKKKSKECEKNSREAQQRCSVLKVSAQNEESDVIADLSLSLTESLSLKAAWWDGYIQASNREGGVERQSTAETRWSR